MKTTLVIGASENIDRYSNIAINLLRFYQYNVYAIGNKKGKIKDVEIAISKIPFKDVHTITLYISEKYQKEYYEYILSLSPKRIIFNPGTENQELENLAQKNNIQTINACTLVMLKTQQF